MTTYTRLFRVLSRHFRVVMKQSSMDSEQLRWELGAHGAEFVRLIEYIQSVSWGQITIEIKDGAPVMIHEIRKDIKLST